MQQPRSDASISDEILPHDSVNLNGTSTILLIHGALGNRTDWDMVVPFLGNYHLLIPDLPGHGASTSFAPYSAERAAQFLNELVKAKAKGGVAHIVGHSLGAGPALSLAAQYPEHVQSVVISGYGRLPRNWFTPYLPYAVWTSQRIENLIPRPAIRWLMDGTDLRRGSESSWNIELIRQCFVGGMSSGDWPKPWRARTLVIAATKKGIIPSDDNAVLAKKIAEIGKVENPETRAMKHGLMRHPWTRQAPELFAETVEAWIERRQVPNGFEDL